MHSKTVGQNAPRPVRILLVEDNQGDVLLAREALSASRIDHDMEVVNDGEEALLFLRKEGSFSHVVSPDVIFLDINLPRLDGREVLEAIRSDSQLKDLHVIVLSGANSEREILESQGLIANGFMEKPMAVEGILEIVGKLTPRI